jgi:hypothetical protein
MIEPSLNQLEREVEASRLKPSPPVSLKVDKVEGALRKRVAQ